MLRILRDQKGQAAMMVGVSMVAMLGLAALAIDMGLLYVQRAQLVSVADAAALAGAQDLPRDVGEATQVAKDFADSNGLTADDAWNTPAFNPAGTAITVSATRSVPLFFAKILGMASANVPATATAQIFPISVAARNTVIPIGVPEIEYVRGGTFTLKEGSLGNETGNFCILNFDRLPGYANNSNQNGAKAYENDLANGYNSTIKVNDIVQTQPGNISNNTSNGVAARIPATDTTTTYENVDVNNPRVVLVPIISTLPNGAGEVTILGFATFYLESVVGQGKNSVISGRFISMVKGAVLTDTAGTDYGGYGVRLVN